MICLRRLRNAKLALIQRRVEQRGKMLAKRRDLGPRGLRTGGSRSGGSFRSFAHAANMGRIGCGSKRAIQNSRPHKAVPFLAGHLVKSNGFVNRAQVPSAKRKHLTA